MYVTSVSLGNPTQHQAPLLTLHVGQPVWLHVVLRGY